MGKTGEYGGAINNSSTISSITDNFTDNSASKEGGAIYNTGTISNLTGSFTGNHAGGSGGAIYSRSYVDGPSLTIVNSNFLNNYAKSETGKINGGAIYGVGTVNMVAKDGFTSTIDGNYVQDIDGKRAEAIFVSGYLETTYQHDTFGISAYKDEFRVSALELRAESGGKFIINDIIRSNVIEYAKEVYLAMGDPADPSTTKYYIDNNGAVLSNVEKTTAYTRLNLTGDSTGVIELNNDVQNFDVVMDGVQVKLGARENVFDTSRLTLNSGSLNMVNGQVGVSAPEMFMVGGNVNFVADVDLANKQMDRFEAKEYGAHTGKLNVVGMNLISDAIDDATEIFFAETGLKDSVVNGMGQLPDKYQTTVFSPIYKYTVAYDNREDGGFFVFTRGAGAGASTGNASNAFNPAVLPSSTATQTNAFTVQVQSWDFAFNHSDNFFAMKSGDRLAESKRNMYAMEGSFGGVYSPLVSASKNAGIWVKPYAVFENIPLKNGPKVQNITYGTLVGGDSDMERIRGGFDRVFTYYIGYNGASQYFSGVHTYQNGGLLGFTTTLYKKNFFNATTISTGANVAESQTMYGNEYFTMFTAGIANKSGYNFELKGGKFIVQPTFMIGYTFVNTFDYTNAAGVRIDSDPFHAILLSPGIKFIANTAKGWQPYFAVNMVWNPMNISKVMANDVKLPEMSIKPYVMYGLGVQKRFKDKFLAFGQAMLYNGGRNGVALTAGLRWMIGK